MLPYAAWLCGTILLLLLQLRIRIRIQRISRAPIYRTRWEHRALYNSWWLNSLYSNVHPLEMKINHPKGARGPRRYVIKNGQNAVLSRRGTPSLSVYNYIHRGTPWEVRLGTLQQEEEEESEWCRASLRRPPFSLHTLSTAALYLMHACTDLFKWALENRRRRSHRWKQNTAYTQSRFSVGLWSSLVFVCFLLLLGFF